MPIDRLKIAAQVTAARTARKWSQEDLARAAGTSQSEISRIEKGQFKRRPSVLPDVLDALKEGQILDEPRKEQFTKSQVLVGDRDLPVFASAEGGNGAIILSSEPVDFVRRPAPLAQVRDGYGLIVVLDSMVPEFRPGDTVLVHPHLPASRGDACVLYADDGHGTVKAIIKSLTRVTPTHWHVEQWNPPKTFKLSRKDWQKCHRIVGKYSRR